MQRIGKATLKALHEPEGSREQDKDEEDKELLRRLGGEEFSFRADNGTLGGEFFRSNRIARRH